MVRLSITLSDEIHTYLQRLCALENNKKSSYIAWLIKKAGEKELGLQPSPTATAPKKIVEKSQEEESLDICPHGSPYSPLGYANCRFGCRKELK
jgi:hypothetical protein